MVSLRIRWAYSTPRPVSQHGSCMAASEACSRATPVQTPAALTVLDAVGGGGVGWGFAVALLTLPHTHTHIYNPHRTCPPPITNTLSTFCWYSGLLSSCSAESRLGLMCTPSSLPASAGPRR